MLYTPLFPVYEKYGAKLTEFYEWCLPVSFKGIIAEHMAVRESVGIFDVSHMGELIVEGKEAGSFLDFVLTNRVTDMVSGMIRYSPVCYIDGGTVDDILVYCLTENKYLLVVNAGNIESDLQWLLRWGNNFSVSIWNLSEQTAQIALQGPNSENVLAKLLGAVPPPLKYYHFAEAVEWNTAKILISRTGYTGEMGYEIYCQSTEAVMLWDALLAAGVEYGIEPIGLGARDTLRFEAGLPLFGHELSETISPVEAGLSRFIKFDKADFIGKKSLQDIAANCRRRLIGLEITGRAIPRAGYDVFCDQSKAGQVTSGGFCPYLKKNLAMALVESASESETEYQVEVRGEKHAAKIREIPFYRKGEKLT